jgi:tetratricopeptide (TPR) repeat protein
MTAEEIMIRFENYADLRRLNSARKTLEDAMKNVSERKLELQFNYNLGSLYWSNIGDGVKARHYYKAAAESNEDNFSDLKSNATENMMILSTSYEEYFVWADKLKEFKPTADILIGQYPDIKRQQDAGTPWYEASYSIASSFYNRNDTKADRGMYGCAASIYQILLTNRKEMRITKDYLESIFFEYIALMYKVVSQAVAVVVNKGIKADPEDYMFMIDQVRGYVDQYSEVITFNDDMNIFIKAFKEWRDKYDEIEARTMVSSTTGYGYSGYSNPTELNDEGSNDIEIRCPYCGCLNSIDSPNCTNCALPLNRSGVDIKKFIITTIAFIGMVVLVVGWLLKWW